MSQPNVARRKLKEMFLSHRTIKLLLGFTCRLAETHLEDMQLRTLEPESSLLYVVTAVVVRGLHG